MESSSNSCMIGNEESGGSAREAGRYGKGGAAATMASIRLSGMEISDLTMELNGVGCVLTPDPQLLSVSKHDDSNVWEIDMNLIVDSRHEISKGAKSSARALNAVESRTRQVGGLASNGECQTTYHHHSIDKSYILVRTITVEFHLKFIR